MFKLCLLIAVALALGPEAVKGLQGALDAAPNEYPYHAFIRLRNKNFCSGVLISPKHILSAGHCIYLSDHSSGPLTALVGTNSLTRGGQSYPIVAKIQHPGYVYRHNPDLRNDLGIFTLGSNVVPSNSVSIARLPSNDHTRPRSNAVVAAAGSTKPRGSPSKVLQKLAVSIMDRGICQSKIGVAIDETFICAIAGDGKGCCSGDSGAPLVQNGLVVGILSGGIDCNKPAIFANVHRYMDWIRPFTR